jgi:cytochrome c oxidase subunit 4
MTDHTTSLLDPKGNEIAVGSRVRHGPDTGVVRRMEPAYGVMTIVVAERNAKKERMVRATEVEVLPDEPAPAPAAEDVAAAAGHAAAHHGGDRMYYTTWLWLLAITVLEVGVAVLRIPRVLLITTLIVMSFFKAILIMATFMHLRFERIQFIYTVVVPLFFGVLLFFAVVPDAVNTLTREPVQASTGTTERPPAPTPGGPGGPTTPGGQPPSGPVATGSTIEIIGKDNLFEPSAITIKAGQAYDFIFKNQGTTVHNSVISAGGQTFASDVAVNAGQDSKYAVKIDAPGDYPMNCTYHPEMTGTVSVVR